MKTVPRFWTYPIRFVRLARDAGLKAALRQTARRVLGDPSDGLPLARADHAGFLTADVEAVHEDEKEQIRGTSLLFDASKVEQSYPLSFEADGRVLRYAFLPAAQSSKGLVVLFHGHDAHLHLGPLRAWREFDVLAPWDTFGWQRRGSWFWGEHGDNFVEKLVQALIDQHRTRASDKPWFCTGGSMGGTGALYHGIKHGCDGVYVVCPQVDLGRKVVEYGGAEDADNPYGYLVGDTVDGLPDILAEARARDDLPPLYLIQNQYDHVNPFAEHAWHLIDIYNRKNAWYGLRIHPAVGHGGDGQQEEAALFFSLIIDKRPPSTLGAAGG